jgi:hypothetical protein
MKKLALLLALCSPSFAAYTICVPATTDHTQAGASDSTNFPLKVTTGPGDALKTTGNGGYITNASGFDHAFFSDNTCTTKLKWDNTFYDGAAGKAIDFVLFPTLSSSSNQTIYEGIGNAAITTFQGDVAGTWVTYRQVMHLNESSNPYADATGNGFNSTAGTYPTRTTDSLFGFAQSFVAASSQYIQTVNSVTTGAGTYSQWFKVSSIGGIAMGIYDNRGNASQFGIVNYLFASTGVGTTYCNSGTVSGASNLADGNWHEILSTKITTGGGDLYIDGVHIGTTSGCNIVTAGNASIGAAIAGGISSFLNGLEAEVRTISNVFVSSWWVTAEWNSMKPGSTFVSITLPPVVSGVPGQFPRVQ